MIDFNQLEKYRENNRIEAKKALGGLPQSIWETYSAFANTLGGIILLGVIELEDHSLQAVDLPDPDRLIREFWALVNDPRKASINILSDNDVYPLEVEGKSIVVINVPRADRIYRPVFVDGDPKNTYRRNGEGDYKCTPEEYQAMVRDASVKTQDMRLISEMGMNVFNMDSLHSYRRRMKFSRPGHVWGQLSDEEFLLKIGAAGIGEDGKKHPTAAGLLMFGNEPDILREYNHYCLDYQVQYGPENRLINRIVSSSGDWSGNISDFYFRISAKFEQDINLEEESPVYFALREALANSLVHADYYGKGGVVIIKRPDRVILSNPGSLRIEKNTALNGEVSDPRNAAILRMFHLMDIGERFDRGIPIVFSIWKGVNWAEPVITEEFNPDRVTLTLPLSTGIIGDKKPAINSGDKNSAISMRIKDSIILYLTDHPEVSTMEIAEALGLKISRTRDYLKELAEDRIVEIFEINKKRFYRLKR